MTNRDVAMLAFKVFAFWLFANTAIAIAGLPFYWQPEYYETRRWVVLGTLLPVLVSIGIAVPLWLSADWFAARIFPGEPQPPIRFDRLRGEPLVAVACSVIGILLVAEALPVFVYAVSLFSQSRSGSTILGPHADEQSQIWSAAAKANLAAGVARFLIGLALIAGPARLARAVGRIRKELTGDLEAEEGPRDV